MDKEMTNDEYLNFLNTIDTLPKKEYEIIRRGVLQLNEDKKELLSYIEQLQNNRDKAIEMLTYKQNAFSTCFSVCDVIDILKGDSE